MVGPELWCISRMRVLLAVNGRPRFHWQVVGEEGAGAGRGGVACMAPAMCNSLGSREPLSLFSFSTVLHDN